MPGFITDRVLSYPCKVPLLPHGIIYLFGSYTWKMFHKGVDGFTSALSRGVALPEMKLGRALTWPVWGIPPYHTPAHHQQGLLTIWATNLEHVFWLHFGTTWVPTATGVFFWFRNCCQACNQKLESFPIHNHQPSYTHLWQAHWAEDERNQHGFFLAQHTFLLSDLPRSAVCSSEVFMLRCLLTSGSWKTEFNKMNGVNLESAWNRGKMSYFSIAK